MKLADVSPAQLSERVAFRAIYIALAILYVVMSVAQLFRFHRFVPLVESFWLPGGDVVTALFAAVVVSFQILALPFLLGMPVSKLMRAVSMVTGLTVALLWLVVAIFLAITTNAVTNVGYFGVELAVPVGWVSVALMAIVVGLWIAVLCESWQTSVSKSLRSGKK